MRCSCVVFEVRCLHSVRACVRVGRRCEASVGGAAFAKVSATLTRS